MDWFLVAIASTTLVGLVTVLDKRLLDVHFPSVTSLTFMVGMVQGLWGALILVVTLPLLGVPDVGYMALAFVAGLLWGLGLVCFFLGLRLEEVSRAAPIFGTSPLFAALLAVVFLAEELTAVQWASMVAIVAGAGMLSLRAMPWRGGLMGGRALMFILMGALLVGSAFVVNKQASEGLAFWTMFACLGLGMALSISAVSYRPGLRSQMVAVLRNPAAWRLFVIAEVVLASGAVLLLQLAIKLGPVSMVSAINATRPLFVLIFSVALSTRLWNVLNEPLDRDTLALKLASTVLVVAGLVGLTAS